MAGKSGIRNLEGMLGRRKGGQATHSKNIKHHTGSLRAHLDEFLEHMRSRSYSDSTIETHRWALIQFIDWSEAAKHRSPSSLSRSDLEGYQKYLFGYISPRTGRALAINTQIGRLGCVQRFFARLCRNGHIPANPAADLDLPRKQPRQLPKTLTPQEIGRLMAKPDLTSPFGIRDRAILEVFYATGIRRHELVQLDINDYNPAEATLHIRKGKGGRPRILPVGRRASFWLVKYLDEVYPVMNRIPSETALFLSGYASRMTAAYLGNWVRKQLRAIGVQKPGSCHLFRHSCATHMHQAGADIRVVQEMLGHARLDTTQIYTHLNIEDLRAAHDRYHPSAR